MKPYAHLIGGELAYLSTTTIEWTHANSMTIKVANYNSEASPMAKHYCNNDGAKGIGIIMILSSDKDYKPCTPYEVVHSNL